MHIEEGAVVGAVVGSLSTINGAGGEPFAVATIIDVDDTPTMDYQNYKFVQTEELTEAGIAVHPYGAFVMPMSALLSDPVCVLEFNGKLYEAAFADTIKVGDPVVFELIEDEGGGGGNTAD